MRDVEGVDDLMDCLDESLEMTVAQRCLGYGEEGVADYIRIFMNGAACLLQTQQNATIVVEKFLNLSFSNVIITIRYKTNKNPSHSALQLTTLPRLWLVNNRVFYSLQSHG